MEFVKARLSKWIQAAIILVVGILCIVVGAKIQGQDFSGAEDAINAISVTLGVVLIVFGSLSLLLAGALAFLVKKGLLLAGLPGAFLLAVGISLCVVKYAYNLIMILIAVVPYVLIVVGALVLLEGCLNLYGYLKNKGSKGALIAAIVVLTLGVVAIVLGALCVGTNPVIDQHVQLIIFGIIVALEGALTLLGTFVKVPDVIVVAEKK